MHGRQIIVRFRADFLNTKKWASGVGACPRVETEWRLVSGDSRKRVKISVRIRISLPTHSFSQTVILRFTNKLVVSVCCVALICTLPLSSAC